ncbi:phosphate/phosphite/phosphonate ABC transporter substrate-binding protein [Chitinilyticum piscinae]|uniref:Phosphate/phosphite/phosphonate ABC transporter substrate-binding protein n=1 Tax=Chitinilyticum piscinae TaxID=2866724 RepID=A0A8J7FKN6_9NEIS|nr:PhnD/SsuA/transferrin family substrate-binding protein [Chitinilyticum piscinae]MBE9607876.1 phosphate/phosphite/phosphonate ABC transporter substrate-binding protein [Chitinilyticum piscinae]
MRVLLALAALLLTSLLSGCGREEQPPGPQYSTAPAASSKPEYTFAVHPLHNPAKLIQAYQPLIDELNRRIPEATFKLESSKDYASFEQKITAKSPQFILPNPWQTLQAMQSGYRVIAMAGDETEFRGLILVRKDSPVRQPTDLKGKAVSYPSATALAACILPQYFLYQQGIDINKDLENRYVGSQESSIMNVFLGETAAGATWTLPWTLFQKEHPAEAAQLRVAWETPHLQNNSVMVHHDVPATVASKVQHALFALTDSPEGRRILDGMATKAFYPASNETYTPVQNFIADFERKVRPVKQP